MTAATTPMMTAMAEKSMAVHHLRIASASTLSAWCAFVDGSTSRYGHVRGRAGAGEPSLVASLLPLGKVIRAQLRGWDPSTGWAWPRALERTPSQATSTCAERAEDENRITARVQRSREQPNPRANDSASNEDRGDMRRAPGRRRIEVRHTWLFKLSWRSRWYNPSSTLSTSSS